MTMLRPVDKSQLTHEQKLALYEKGHYKFSAPGVCTAYWNTDAWINWIDAGNNWLIEVQP